MLPEKYESPGTDALGLTEKEGNSDTILLRLGITVTVPVLLGEAARGESCKLALALALMLTLTLAIILTLALALAFAMMVAAGEATGETEEATTGGDAVIFAGGEEDALADGSIVLLVENEGTGDGMGDVSLDAAEGVTEAAEGVTEAADGVTEAADGMTEAAEEGVLEEEGRLVYP